MLAVALLVFMPLGPCLSENSTKKEHNTSKQKKSLKQAKPNTPALVETKKSPAEQNEKNTTNTKETQKNQNAKSDAPPLEKPSPLLLRAEEHFFKKRYHIALRLLKRVIDEEPENARAYLYAADIYLLQQNYGLAEEYFQIARELSPHPYKEWFRLGQVRYLRGDGKGALAAFQESYKLKPTEHKNLFYMGMVYYHLLKDKKKTIEAWTEFRKKVPDDPQGPAIDKALQILADPNFEFPKGPASPCFSLPAEKESKVPYKPGRDAQEKTDNKGEDAIEIDDL